MTEYPQHFAAKHRIVEIISPFNPMILQTEYMYHNPENESNDPRWEWKFDVYCEIGDRKIAIELDGWKGHWSRLNREQTKQNIAKRKFKVEYLKTKEIEFFAHPVKDLIGKKKLPDSVFIDELHLNSIPVKEWYNE